VVRSNGQDCWFDEVRLQISTERHLNGDAPVFVQLLIHVLFNVSIQLSNLTRLLNPLFHKTLLFRFLVQISCHA